jgi:arabinogalactan endo-1,4-beta-galactosidase
MTGVDANYSRGLIEKGAGWQVAGEKIDLFRALKNSGASSFRVRVWINDNGPSGFEYACAVAKQAQAAGLRPLLVFFLSDDWADYVKQPVPALWAKIELSEKLNKVTEYCENTARRFKEAGVETDLYAIGNEIDFGICGEFEEKWENRFNVSYMNEHIWNKEASIINAAEAGVRRIDPKARFMLHLTQWWNPEFCSAFLDAMLRAKVQVDLLGLSFYPSSGLSEKNTFADLGASVEAIARKTQRASVICESAYPSQEKFGGQFSSWNKPVPGYPLNEAGQKKWVQDFYAFCRENRNIKGAFYWSPEWYTDEMWQAFALFRPDGSAKDAFAAFRTK